MSTISPAYPISSISGRYSSTDRVHTRANRTTGKTYGVALTRPNRQSKPTPAQQQSRAAFRATWQKVDAILADPAARAYYTALWQAHTSACRHHRPLSQSAINALSQTLIDSLPQPAIDSLSPSTLASLQNNSSFLIPNSQLNNNSSFLIPNSSLFNSRRTPFSTPRTLLFHLLYHT